MSRRHVAGEAFQGAVLIPFSGTTMAIQVNPDWWKTLFDEIYLITDARSVCDEEVTRREVDLICELLQIRPDHKILDLCGGHGRHSLELAARGIGKCTLVDYSHHLIDHARTCAAKCGHQIECLQQDARNTGLAEAGFDHVIIMGNSLGYLADPTADADILAEANRVLRSGGWLLVDVVDGKAVRTSLNPLAWHEIAPDKVVCRQREILGERIYAREMVLSKHTGLIRDSAYAVKLYDAEAIVTVIEQAGFSVARVDADFSSHRLKGDYGFMNRRIIATARKP
jgi:D-alanine-D-alanine ligase